MASPLLIRIRRGLDLPVEGAPGHGLTEADPVGHVGLVGRDYPGLRLAPLVEEGRRVALGEPVLGDRRDPRIVLTAPAGGVVIAVNRGERRVLRSLVIRVDGDEQREFEPYAGEALPALGREEVTGRLCDAGLWAGLRVRPYNRVPPPGSVPFAITVTAIDTNPLAPDPAMALADAGGDFAAGLQVLLRLTEGTVYVCTAPGADIPVPEDERLVVAQFSGPHPAGLPGTHIHMLCPAGPHRSVWHAGYQDVVAIGRLFTRGRLSVERVASLAGPMVREPSTVRTRAGASLYELLDGNLHDGEVRVISGSMLGGAAVTGDVAYLGRYDNQVTVLAEGREREFLGWLAPGSAKFSLTNAYLSALRRRLPFGFTTNQNGSPRAMIPIGSYERVMPLDILPTQLLRALLVRDLESALALGALELAEEDLALCTFVCPSKYDYGPVLREVLDQLEKEG